MSDTALRAAEIIRIKRDGGRLSDACIAAFVDGLADPGAANVADETHNPRAPGNPTAWTEGQVAALAMAIVLRGMDEGETVSLTQAMTRSGTVMDWSAAGFSGPVLDKHSTGGVGDKVSLLLAPIMAACGAVVPMVSGRGLGHTGGTLDKLQALPGYDIRPSQETLLATLRSAGCAIVGASHTLAPADRRLYAIRDTTATVESLPLITASILSKKLAAGLQGLVLDVKVGSGAFMPTPLAARELALSLVQVAQRAGLPARALLTDMNQILGRSAGHTLEVQETIDHLKGSGPPRDPRLHAVTMALAAELLVIGGLVDDLAAGLARAEAALASGAAAERFAQMVRALGGSRDVLADAGLAQAPVRLTVAAPRSGVLAATDARALGLVVLGLGGGRHRPEDRIDPRVGLLDMVAPGTPLQAGDPLVLVHAATDADARRAEQAVLAALSWCEPGATLAPLPPLIVETVRP
ncbi:MAG: thymidine phosphorylase [Rubrivivax sp.]